MPFDQNDYQKHIVKQAMREYGRKGGLARTASQGEAGLTRIGKLGAKARWKGKRKKKTIS